MNHLMTIKLTNNRPRLLYYRDKASLSDILFHLKDCIQLKSRLKGILLSACNVGYDIMTFIQTSNH